MILRSAVIAALAALFLSGAAQAQDAAQDAGPAPAASAAFPHGGSDLPPYPGVTYGTLENGFRYAIAPHQAASGGAALLLTFNVGSLSEGEDERGFAHFLEHMAFNGSENIPEGELGPMLQRHGLAFGADVNARTSFSETTYMLQLPNGDAQTLDAGFTLFSELDQLTLAEEAVESERGVVLAELRARNTPVERTNTARYEFLYPRALLGDRAIGGSPETLQAADAAALRRFYTRTYRPGRAFLAVAGDIDVADIEDRIAAAFGDWQPAQGADPDRGEAGFDAPAAGFLLEPSAPATVTLYSVKPAEPAPDTRAARETQLAEILANAIVSRRLARLADANPDVHGGQAGYAERERTAAVGAVTVAVRSGAWREGLGVAESTLRQALRFGFNQAELDEQAARMRSMLEAQAQQAEVEPNIALAMRLVGQFHSGDVATSPEFDLALFDELLPRMTPQTVAAALRDIWAEIPPTIFVIDGQDIPDASATILSAYREAVAQPVTAPETAAAAEFAHTDFGPPGTVASRQPADDLGIVRIRFANNVMLNYKHTDFSPGAASAVMAFGGGGMEFPQDRPELRHVISALAAGGTEAHSLDDLRSILAGKRVTVAFLLNTDAFMAMAPMAPEEALLTQMQIWAAYLTEPAFRPEGFSAFRNEYKARQDAQQSSAIGVLNRNMAFILQDGKNLPYPPVEAFDGLDAATAHAAMADAFEREMIEISVVGDVTEAQAIDAVARTLGALPEREAAPRPFTEARRMNFPSAGAHELTHPGPDDTAAALIAWPTDDATDAARARRLEALAQVLQMRVTERVREQAGASYSPFVLASLAEEFPGYGYISVRTDLRPDDVDGVIAMIEAEAAQLAANGASQDELDRAVRPMIEGFSQRTQQNLFWAQMIVRAQSYPERLNRVRSVQEDLAAITTEEIAALAQRYFDPAKAVRIEVKPD